MNIPWDEWDEQKQNQWVEVWFQGITTPVRLDRATGMLYEQDDKGIDIKGLGAARDYVNDYNAAVAAYEKIKKLGLEESFVNAIMIQKAYDAQKNAPTIITKDRTILKPGETPDPSGKQMIPIKEFMLPKPAFICRTIFLVVEQAIRQGHEAY